MSHNLMRSSAAQILEGEETSPWHPVPGKKTLSQQLPVQRRSDVAAVAAVLQFSLEGTGGGAHAEQAAGAAGAAGAGHAGSAPQAGAGALADPFAVHLMGDSFAPAVARSAARPQTGQVVQRKALGEALRGGAAAQRAEAAEAGEAGEVAASAGAPSGGGQALPDDVRVKMELAFGADFSAVRIHEGGHAASLGALAYAQGSELHFAPGQYQPHSEAGQELLGHELAHVVQQAQGRVQSTAQAKGAAINDDAGLEREADELGARAARGEAATAVASAPAVASSPSSSSPSASSHVASSSSSASSAPAAAADAIQCRKLHHVVPVEAKITASSSGQWMLVQGLGSLGFPQWHLTIFPSNQDNQSKWKNSFALPAQGSRPVTQWMEYDELHITSPEGEHFYYTDGCVPLAASLTTGARSPAWASEHWQWANWLCANWFQVDLQALNTYVAERPQHEQAERNEQQAEQAYQEIMWKRYLHWVQQCPELYAKTQMPFEQWRKQFEDGFTGSYQELREHIRKEDRESGGKLADYPKREWRDDDEGFGYV